MSSRGQANRRRVAWNRARHLHQQCAGKKAFPSKKAAGAVARLMGQAAYKCAVCGSHHTGHRPGTNRPSQAEAATAPIMTVSPGEGKAWTAARLLQAVSVFAHHYGREPVRMRPVEGRLAFW